MSDVHRSEDSVKSMASKKPQHMTWAESLESGYALIYSALMRGRDVLAMPPGGQLRLHWYRQLAMQLPGITLIISPFQERMKKEVDMLDQNGIPAVMLHSGFSDYAMAVQLERIRRHHFRMLYISPGLLENLTIRLFLVHYTTISLIVIDEAHSFSIHAPYFQPLYQSIPLFLKNLERYAMRRQAMEKQNSPPSAFSDASAEASHSGKSAAPLRPPILAVTLPTTRQVEQDIARCLSFHRPLLVRHEFTHPNLFLSVHRPQRKAPFLLDYLRRHKNEAGIIYCTEHRLTEHIAQLLSRSGFPALSYHKGLSKEERTANIRAFCAGVPSPVDCNAASSPESAKATQADAGPRILVVTPDPYLELERPDVRFVLHYTLPESLDRYYQEIIRAGRDGLPAECILLANERDSGLQRTKLAQTALRYARHQEAIVEVKRQFEAMHHYAMTHQCLRMYMKDYFTHIDSPSTTSALDNTSISAPPGSSLRVAEACTARASVNMSGRGPLCHADGGTPARNLNGDEREPAAEAFIDYELITLPSQSRVLTRAELPIDESLRTIKQFGRYPKNRVQKVSMQLKRAEKQHVFIRYAEQKHMLNQAYKYEHLRTDPWERCEPGLRVQNFRAFSIPRDACCVNCNPEHFLEEDRYGVSDSLGLQERMREHLHLLETDTDAGRKLRLWKAGEKQYQFDYDAHARRTGRIMAMRNVEYQKNVHALATALGESAQTPSQQLENADGSSIHARTSGFRSDTQQLENAGGSSIHARTSEFRSDTQQLENAGGSSIHARTSEFRSDTQQLQLLETARHELSAEMRTQLLGNLKALRKRLAMERNVQSYQIFTDKSLVEMCRMLPLTREEFACIHGVGPKKLALHYEAFTDEIRKALDPVRVADFYENMSEELPMGVTDGTAVHIGVESAEALARVVDFYENVSEELPAVVPDSAAHSGMESADDMHSSAVQTKETGTVIKSASGKRSELQRNSKYRFIPDDVLLAFLEEKYLQQRTRKQVKKKQDFFLTVEEAATFRCADGLRSPEIAALLNELVEEAEQQTEERPIIETETQISDVVTMENPAETQTADVATMKNPAEMQISDAVAMEKPADTENPQKLCAQKRKKLYGTTIDRKLAELGYLELSEYSIAGRPRQAYLPTTKGEAAGIARGTRKSQGGMDYPTAYFSAAAAGWVASLFVREVTE